MFPFLRILGLSWVRYLLLSYFSTYACGTLRMQIGSSVADYRYRYRCRRTRECRLVHYEVYENYSDVSTVGIDVVSNAHIQWFGNPDYGHPVILIFNYLGTRRNILLPGSSNCAGPVLSSYPSLTSLQV